MEEKDNINNRLSNIERSLEKLNKSVKPRNKKYRLLITAAFIVEKLWRIFKHYVFE